jgi:lysozyme family protein
MGAASDQPEFDRCVDVVLAHEGGYVHHPADPGAATNFGITQSTLARARGRKTTETDVRLLSKEEACAIYRRFYWDTIRASEMSAGVALAVFDFAVNSGVPGAVRQLQSVLGIVVDGVVGDDTLRALSRADAPGLVRQLTQGRLTFLARLPTWPVFGRGWRKRVLSVEQDALRLILGSIPTS